MKKESVIDYGEYVVAEEITKLLNAGNKVFKEYSVFAPLSRQEKGIDLIIYKKGVSKVATVQVKSSKSYVGIGDHNERTNYTWLNTFSMSDENPADFYAIVGTSLALQDQKNIDNGLSIRVVDYSPMVLIYTSSEMKEELSKIRLKNNINQDRFFGYRFRDEEDIVLSRGFVQGYNTLNNGSRERSKYVLKNRKDIFIDYFLYFS